MKNETNVIPFLTKEEKEEETMKDALQTLVTESVSTLTHDVQEMYENNSDAIELLHLYLIDFCAYKILRNTTCDAQELSKWFEEGAVLRGNTIAELPDKKELQETIIPELEWFIE